MQNNRWLQILIVLLVIICSAWLAGQVWGFVLQFSNILLLFFLSWLLAFILRPVARWLNSRGMPYTLAVAVVYLSLGFILVIAGILLVPVISSQIELLSKNTDQFTTTVENLINDAQKLLKSWGVQASDLNRMSTDLLNQGQAAVLSVLQNTLTVLQSVATLVLQLIFIFLISFYIMKDGDKLAAGALRMLPSRWEDEIRLVALSIEKSFGGFIRGQLIFAIIYGFFNAIVMMLFGLDYVVIASIVAGFCMLIPLVGNFLAYVPPLLVGIVTKPDSWFWLLIALLIAQSIVMNFVGPRVMSSAIGLHPIYVVAAMLIGGQVAGIWGALFGIPIAGAMNLIGRPVMRRVRHQMPLYQDTGVRSLSTSAFVTGPLAASMVKAHQTQMLPTNIPDEGPVEMPDEVITPAPAVVAQSQSQVQAQVPAQAQDETFADMEADSELMVKHNPTLTARAFRLIIVLGSRSVNWAWSRARREASGANK